MYRRLAAAARAPARRHRGQRRTRPRPIAGRIVGWRGHARLAPPGASALRLDDVMATGLVLFKLAADEYPHATRKVASWILLGMGRVARQLAELRSRESSTSRGRCSWSTRSARSRRRHAICEDWLGARGKAASLWSLPTQGPQRPGGRRPRAAPPGPAGHGLAAGVPSGQPHDARQVEALFGQHWRPDESIRSAGSSINGLPQQRWRVDGPAP